MGAITVILAVLPGRHVYADANNCFAGLGTRSPTDPARPATRTSYAPRLRAAGSTIPFAVSVALGAGVVHRKPRRATAIGWAVWTALASIVIVLRSIDFLDFFDPVQLTWASHALAFAAGMMLVLVLLAIPIVIAFTREDPTGSLPVATGSTGVEERAGERGAGLGP